MTERTVVYDDECPYAPLPDFVEPQAPTATHLPASVARRHQTLRSELSALNHQRAAAFPHEATHGNTPSILYQPAANGTHGNFFPASYRRILADSAWSARLTKAYTASRRIAHSNARERCELDCANSSDALLMNIFCHPAALRSKPLHALLGLSQPNPPQFGFHPRTPLHQGHLDRTEIDMLLQDTDRRLLVEAKLSETGFQTARTALLERYPTFQQVFDTDLLPRSSGNVRSYQLLRSILATHHLNADFTVMLDARRTDLLEDVFLVYRAVRSAHLRSRLHVITWQQIAACMPRTLQSFLGNKYGIVAAR